MAPKAALFMSTEEGEPLIPFHTFRFNLRTVLTAPDNATLPSDPASHKPPLHILHARPFNHLSVWAYLAFAFIVLATTTVISYAIYSCYHSSRKKMEAGMALPVIPVGQNRVTWADLETSDTLVKVEHTAGVGEKANLGSVLDSKIGLDMARNRGGHKRIDSDSEVNMFSRPSNSSSMPNVNDMSFESDTQYLTSPPLAHTSDKSATYIPFHLPPPPPSPTPAHKENLERQYRGRVHQSPVSPSPSFSFTTSLPQITPINPQLSADDRSRQPWNSTALTGSSRSTRQLHNTGFEEWDDTSQFDTNNNRFVPHLNPFMAPPSAQLWNDPKLSPVQGSMISKANTSGSSTTGESSFSKAVMEASYSSPPVSARKRSKSILGNDVRRHREDKENVDGSFHDMPYGRNIA
ncbi:hypothetical protein JR316_0005232 [Psilocybe cubensis]|uniref:Uncharacterized protein n=2 Tax=Psilocybe cubensis TaxID=181762 RepID=A0A8H8CKD3_PSICU|nr:hypothetical protein JR316_0005232 [Psilocybe cubensis]KAH9483130.1 hypothetical protein JR316_0005232 [Psilocybe cubensis]